MTNPQIAIMIGIMALFTFLTRATPFVLFPANKPTPAYILYLGKVLPYSIIAMLVVYCLKDVRPLTWPYGIPEGISVLLVALTYLWKRNSLLSIGLGTILYMVLVQTVF